MAKRKNFDITFGYRAVIKVCVVADGEEQARELAKKQFNDKFRLPGASNIVIEDDCYQIAGVLNVDDSFNMLYEK